MNALDGATYGFTVQFGRMDSYDAQNGNTSSAQQTQDPNSFLSILNLLDVNADGKTDTDELKFGAGFMINSMVQSKDLNGDQALSAEEAGIPQSAVTQLDTDSDGTLSAKELIAPADKIIDGLVPLLDTNGDGALSPDELAIFQLLFNGNSSFAALKGAGSGATQEVSGVNQAPSEAEALQQAAIGNQTAPLESAASQQLKKTVSLVA